MSMLCQQVWSSGQDQAAVLKRQLQRFLPGLSVFLDVDDLRSIDDLEEYINRTAVRPAASNAWYSLLQPNA